MYKYLVEFLGVFVIITADLLTEADPVIIGLTYFLVLTMTHGITSGFFNPFIPIASYALGHGSFKDAQYNIIAQIAGGLTAILFQSPLKVYIT